MKKLNSLLCFALSSSVYAGSDNIIIDNKSHSPIYGAFQSSIMDNIAADSQNGTIYSGENHHYLPEDDFFSSTTVNIKLGDTINKVGVFDLSKQRYILCDENVIYSGEAQYVYNGSDCIKQENKMVWIEVVPGDVNQLVRANADGTNAQIFAQREGLTTVTYNDEKIYTRISGFFENGIGVYDLDGQYLGNQIQLAVRGLGNTAVDPINNWIYNSTELMDVIVRNDLSGDGSDSNESGHVIYDPVQEGCMSDCNPMGLGISENTHSLFFGVGGFGMYPAQLFRSELGEHTLVNRSLLANEESGIITGTYFGIMNIVVDDLNQKVYWNTAKAVQRSNFDGSNLETLYLDENQNENLFALSMSKDSKYLYWSNLNSIHRLDLSSNEESHIIHSGKHRIIAISTY
ncbi:hypothetical protein HC752_09655 [Vibrio sp. S9_S30]|uniref:hypothetical protein n=1 Tax=Vibrio sp. S9_S30 TaxID=2720226 RepID=UPI0016812A29|nr:hypothetical protein [Vibrio sp. S9_S30]MBD1557206.1 hypothetical protein [Vibrio sp. S9_S30]